MSTTRVAHVATIEGTLTYLLLNQLVHIRMAGYDVVSISSPGTQAGLLEKEGIGHIAVPMSRRVEPHSDLVSLWRLYVTMRRERFEIVHVHTPKAALLGQLAARMAKVPIVINTVHGLYLHDRMHPLLRRAYLLEETAAARCSDVILSQNREDVQIAIREGICPATKVRHVGNGIDIARFDPAAIPAEEQVRVRGQLGLPESAPVVGFVGRLAGRRKGVLDLIAAASKVRGAQTDVRFLFVGGSDRGKPDAVHPGIASDRGVADCCLFLGQRPNCELPRLYSIMDLLVLPSLFEGVPRVVMEAAAMQVPAVVTDVRGNREAVEHGVSGLLVPLGDVEALAAAIVDLIQDRERARCMGQKARNLALERFDERLVFDRVTAEYARLLHERGLPVPEPRMAG